MDIPEILIRMICLIVILLQIRGRMRFSRDTKRAGKLLLNCGRTATRPLWVLAAIFFCAAFRFSPAFERGDWISSAVMGWFAIHYVLLAKTDIKLYERGIAHPGEFLPYSQFRTWNWSTEALNTICLRKSNNISVPITIPERQKTTVGDVLSLYLPNISETPN